MLVVVSWDADIFVPGRVRRNWTGSDQLYWGLSATSSSLVRKRNWMRRSWTASDVASVLQVLRSCADGPDWRVYMWDEGLPANVCHFWLKWSTESGFRWISGRAVVVCISIWSGVGTRLRITRSDRTTNWTETKIICERMIPIAMHKKQQ